MHNIITIISDFLNRNYNVFYHINERYTMQYFKLNIKLKGQGVESTD